MDNTGEKKVYFKFPYFQLSEEKKQKHRDAHKRWAEKHPRTEYYKEYDEKRYEIRTPDRMLASARMRSKQRNLPFDLVKGDVVIPETCPICDTELRSAKGIKGGSRQSPTLDRIWCDKGYVKGNIAVICKNCNSKKGNATPDELRRIADWIEQQ